MDERVLKQFYKLRSLDPTDYASDSTEQLEFEYEEDLNSQYELLQQLISIDASSQFGVNGKASKKKDDEEPLGFSESIVEELLEHDIIDDSRDPAKQKYFVSSDSFDAKAYVAMQKQSRSGKELFSRLEYLENEIHTRENLLGGVLHEEFLRFIGVKNALGDIMERFDKGKYADGFQVLGENLERSTQESNNILTPAVDAKNKGSMIRSALDFVNGNKFLFNLPQNLQNDIKLKDYDSLIYDYNKGKHQHNELLNAVEQKRILPSNAALLRRIWEEVEATVNQYKRLIWDKLNTINIDNLNTVSYNIAININNDQNYIALIYKLLELNVEDNPIIEFINIQYYKISAEIEDTFESYEKNLLFTKRDILNTYSLESTSPLSFLVKMLRDTNNSDNSNIRTTGQGVNGGGSKSEESIIALPLVEKSWSLLQHFVNKLSELISKVIKFSSVVDFVITGNFLKQHAEYKKKKAGNEYQVNNHSIERHLRLESYEVKKADEQNEKLILKLCDGLITFFCKTLHDDKLGSTRFSFLPPFSDAISSSIHNASLYKTIALEFEKVAESKLLVSKNSTVIEALQTTCVKINQALQISTAGTLVEDMRNLYVLDLDDDLNLMDLVQMYYSLFTKHASNSIFHRDLSGTFKLIPSKNLLATYETNLLQSLKLLIESSLKKNLVSGDKNTKYKVLMNFYDLKAIIRSDILARYDQYFKNSLSQRKDLEIYQILDNITAEVFESLMAPLMHDITSNFNTSTKSLLRPSPTGVSNMLRKVIAILCNTRVEVLKLKLPPNLTSKIMSRLISTALLKMQDFVKANNTNLEQIIVDIKYFENYFQDQIKSDETLMKILDKVYGILSNKVNMRAVSSQLDPIVNQALNYTKIELDY